MIAAWCALFGSVWLTVFQTALASGAPLGAMAWGGRARVLSARRRGASAAVALFIGIGGCLLAWQALGRADVVAGSVARVLHIGMAVLFGLSLLGNLASKSRIERVHGVPLSALLLASNARLAWGPA